MLGQFSMLALWLLIFQKEPLTMVRLGMPVDMVNFLTGSRSNNLQDVRVLGELPSVATGLFLDIGAHDGEYASNTWLLEKRGWKGVCADPFPWDFSRRTCHLASTCCLNCSDREDDELLGCATRGTEPAYQRCSKGTGSISFYFSVVCDGCCCAGAYSRDAGLSRCGDGDDNCPDSPREAGQPQSHRFHFPGHGRE
mmetsp:Transcript_32129/g.58752  ORF Transcript_32129/g.58752 Transcript_32129/m.58752 type:complete len:196 (+) Transcript_32129:107-694(+)